eukprot:g3677.t1 g3677   contig12:2541303-2542198(+)
MSEIGGGELEQPLLSSSPGSVGSASQPAQPQQQVSSQQQPKSNDNSTFSPLQSSSSSGPRILDRDGTFSQSRGRWSVANNTAYSSGVIGGSISSSNRSTAAVRIGARQRRPVSSVRGGAGANVGDGAHQVPYGIPSTPIQRRPPPPRPTLFRRFFPCCFSSNTCCSPAVRPPLLPKTIATIQHSPVDAGMTGSTH